MKNQNHLTRLMCFLGGSNRNAGMFPFVLSGLFKNSNKTLMVQKVKLIQRNYPKVYRKNSAKIIACEI
jgi:hypothetical protein